MKQLDFCSNSISLSDKQKNFANEQYNKFLNIVCEKLIASNITLNVYTYGSLSLCEPSLIVKNGEVVGLKSDIDFVIVVKNASDIPNVINLFKGLDGVEPQISRGIQVVPPMHIPDNLYYPSIDDMILGLSAPILETFSIDEFVPKLIRHPKAMAYLFVERSVASIIPYYIASTQYSTDKENKSYLSNMTILKAIFAGLRLQFYGVIPDMHGIAGIIKTLPTGIYKTILPDDIILNLVKMREQYDPKAILPDIDMESFMRNVWCTKLKLKISISDLEIIKNIQKEFFYDNNSLLDKLQVLMVGLNFYIFKLNDEIKLFLKDLISEILNSNLISDQIMLEVCKQLLELFNGNDSNIKQEIINLLIKLHAFVLKEHSNVIARSQLTSI